LGNFTDKIKISNTGKPIAFVGNLQLTVGKTAIFWRQSK